MVVTWARLIYANQVHTTVAVFFDIWPGPAGSLQHRFPRTTQDNVDIQCFTRRTIAIEVFLYRWLDFVIKATNDMCDYIHKKCTRGIYRKDSIHWSKVKLGLSQKVASGLLLILQNERFSKDPVSVPTKPMWSGPVRIVLWPYSFNKGAPVSQGWCGHRLCCGGRLIILRAVYFVEQYLVFKFIVNLAEVPCTFSDFLKPSHIQTSKAATFVTKSVSLILYKPSSWYLLKSVLAR